MVRSGVVIQARMGSTRRPGKILYPLQGEPMLEFQLKRLLSAELKDVIVATTTHQRDDVTVRLVENLGVPCFRGSEDDVMGRYLACADAFGLDMIVRVGGDDPLIDPVGIKALIDANANEEYDLVYASHTEGWIYGTAAELVTTEALRAATIATYEALYREHVVTFLKQSIDYRTLKLSPTDKAMIRNDIFVSVDHQEDLDLIEQIVDRFTKAGKRYKFTQQELIALFDSGVLNVANRHLHTGF